jgi:hypothetical protein
MSTIKHDWKKEEKHLYLPKEKPELVNVPPLKFFTIQGEGNPNDAFFAEYIGVLYSLAYGVKMSPKSGNVPEGFYDYSVYPLEGVWDINEEAKKKKAASLDKNSLVFTLMIRQPDFVTTEFANEIIERIKKKKPQPLLDHVKFEVIEEGMCTQMLHIGAYDNEPASFKRMEEFTIGQNMKRKCLTHREIYLSDARKTAQEKLKTVLRFKVE